ncbi:hypothetical protein PAPHI01_1941 [Pancytospora philotis]|nr:hypothetical protein PAPHI01_1941 [Pancytospora philotis]
MHLGAGRSLQQFWSMLAFAGLWPLVRSQPRTGIDYNTDESRALGSCRILSIVESHDDSGQGDLCRVRVDTSVTLSGGGTYSLCFIGYDTEMGEWMGFAKIKDVIGSAGAMLNGKYFIDIEKKGWYAIFACPTGNQQLRIFSNPYFFDASGKTEAAKQRLPPHPQARICWDWTERRAEPDEIFTYALLDLLVFAGMLFYGLVCVKQFLVTAAYEQLLSSDRLRLLARV